MIITQTDTIQNLYQAVPAGFMEKEPNYSRYLKMLRIHPSIKVLPEEEAEILLGEIVHKYRSSGIKNMHYFWSHCQEISMSQTRMKPVELLSYYQTELSKKMPIYSDFYLIIDCCDGSFIVCIGDIRSYSDLLIDNCFELVEIYFADIANNLILCVDHTFAVRYFI